MDEQDQHFMQLALEQARLAARLGEVPVGAVVVQGGRVIGGGRNCPIGQHDPSAHAEIMALREAAKAVGNYRLEDCTLYVTLEPCAMCAGALLNARVSRVVFGATEPKTGAAGSVLDLFAQPALNHHTRVQGGVLADACSAEIQAFFQGKRALQQQQKADAVHAPLREDALRTPSERFANLPDYPWPEHWVSSLPALKGWRMHYLDEGPRDAQRTFLCLHGNPAWSYLYRKMIPVWLHAGHRVVAPDLIGFGKSDKPKRVQAHTFEMHRNTLLQLVEYLDLRNIVLVVQDWGGILGLTLPMEAPHRYVGLVAMNTLLATGEAPLSAGFLEWRALCARKPDFDVGRLFKRGNAHLSEAECAAYNAPFPDAGHRAALRAFAPMVPEHAHDPGAAISRKAAQFWSTSWAGQTLLAVGLQDPVLGLPVMKTLRDTIRHCPEPMLLPDAGHFVQEHGQAIAQSSLAFFAPG